jgi:hypothetical protein
VELEAAHSGDGDDMASAKASPRLPQWLLLLAVVGRKIREPGPRKKW